MLHLDQTGLMLDALKPPSGMEIDVAVGATFTLDLTALLAVPVAATFATEDLEQESASLLETIRRYADRTVLFCQAGAIGVPSTYRAALSLIEQTVVEVRNPTGGIFHPKVWIVRFSGRGDTVHRVLVMSRNLTLDRSWDVMVRLDEDAASGRRMDTGGLSTFLTDLPGRAARELQARQRDLLADLAGSITRARLAVPEPFDAGQFAYLPGTGARRWPFRPTCRNALAISPFLTATAAGSFLASATHRTEVVSRRSALDGAAPGLRTADRLRRLREAVFDAGRTVDDTFDAPDDETTGSQRPPGAVRGLHAKVYVQDDAETATCWLGSANLTTGAFHTNVEVLVALSGAVSAVGTRTLITQEPEKGNLSSLLEDHELPEQPDPCSRDEEISALEGHVLDLSSGDITLTLEPAGEHWDGRLHIAPWQTPEGMSVHARLLSLENDPPVEVVNGEASWLAITQDRITPFVVLECRLDGEMLLSLVRADLIGDPEERRRSVIANAISSREDFLRYLAALLGSDLDAGFFLGGQKGARDSWSGMRADRILEDLLTTASRDPGRLAYLDETLQQLRCRPDAADVVPPDFRDVWDAVYAARRAVIQ